MLQTSSWSRIIIRQHGGSYIYGGGGGARRRASSSFADNWNYDPRSGVLSSETSEQLFQTIIGLEIHAQLNTPDKLLSPSPNPYRSSNSSSNSGENDDDGVIIRRRKPNSALSGFDLAIPGTLPQISHSAVLQAVKAAHALNCEINKYSKFERKHYTYADMPAGYQVTQQRWPIAGYGRLKCRHRALDNKKSKKRKKAKSDVGKKFFEVGIDRIQLEQDSGKTVMFDLNNDITDNTSTPKRSGPLSYVDLNRYGCALIEIVFRPDIKSAAEAAAVVQTLQSILVALDVCDGKMENGSLRCDLNVSIAPLTKSSNSNTLPLDELLELAGNRVEVKNLNSFKQIMAAAEYEVFRQAHAFMDKTPTAQETRTFNVLNGSTTCIRTKEDTVDYRFMPEPDLPPLILDERFLGSSVDDIIRSLPDLPEDVAYRLQSEYNLPEDIALIISTDKTSLELFESALASEHLVNEESLNVIAGTVSNLIVNDILSLINCEEEEYPMSSKEELKLNGAQLGVIVNMIHNRQISLKMAKNILKILFTEEIGADPRVIAESRGLKLITDRNVLERLCQETLSMKQFTDQLETYKNGNDHKRNKVKTFFSGQIMRACNGNADPNMLKTVLEKLLNDVL